MRVVLGCFFEKHLLRGDMASVFGPRMSNNQRFPNELTPREVSAVSANDERLFKLVYPRDVLSEVLASFFVSIRLVCVHITPLYYFPSAPSADSGLAAPLHRRESGVGLQRLSWMSISRLVVPAHTASP